MGDLGVTRWQRYGKDRLYVNDGAVRVGWVDLLDGREVVEDPRRRVDFVAAVAAYRSANGLGATEIPRPTPTVAMPSMRAAERGPLSAPTQPAWTDLAANVPGQAARAQAERELAEMRDRSRVGALVMRAFDVKTDERAWRVGADGEETVGARLEKLRKHGWHVLHAVPIGNRGSDMDHVLIGPGGVWTVNTKTHPDGRVWVGQHQIRVNGRSTRYLDSSRYEADRAARLLSSACGVPVLVRPALVFLTGTLIPNVTIKQLPEDVAVLDRMDIPRAFRRAPRRLDDQQVDAVYEQARRSTTWR